MLTAFFAPSATTQQNNQLKLYVIQRDVHESL